MDSIVLNGTGLVDESAIQIINQMDRTTVKSLDVSYNPALTNKFYDALCKLMLDRSCNLERLELEGNKIGDKILQKICLSAVAQSKLTFLNVSKCEVTDKGAIFLAQLIKGNKKFVGLFAHYNRIMGNGGGAIADAIAGSTSMQLLDMSFNSICGNGKVQQLPEETEDKKEAKKPEKKKK